MYVHVLSMTYCTVDSNIQYTYVRTSQCVPRCCQPFWQRRQASHPISSWVNGGIECLGVLEDITENAMGKLVGGSWTVKIYTRASVYSCSHDLTDCATH